MGTLRTTFSHPSFPYTVLLLCGAGLAGIVPSAAADPDSPYCVPLTAALPGINATYQELKTVADQEATAGDQDDDSGSSNKAPLQPASDLLDREIGLADKLSRQLNDLRHQTQEPRLQRIASEAADTANSFAGSLRAKQDGSPTDDGWSADFNYSANKVRNEMNALNHICQVTGSQDTGDTLPPPERRR